AAASRPAAAHPARRAHVRDAGRLDARRAPAPVAPRELLARRRQQGHADRGGRHMSRQSRTAERAHRSARSLDGAGATARLARVYGNLLLDLPRQAGLKWDMLIEITGGGDLYRALRPEPATDTAERFFIADRDNPSSMRSALTYARESIRTTRDIVPSEA